MTLSFVVWPLDGDIGVLGSSPDLLELVDGSDAVDQSQVADVALFVGTSVHAIECLVEDASGVMEDGRGPASQVEVVSIVVVSSIEQVGRWIVEAIDHLVGGVAFVAIVGSTEESDFNVGTSRHKEVGQVEVGAIPVRELLQVGCVLLIVGDHEDLGDSLVTETVEVGGGRANLARKLLGHGTLVLIFGPEVVLWAG